MSRVFLQIFAFANEVFCSVAVKDFTHNCTILLGCAIAVNQQILININVIERNTADFKVDDTIIEFRVNALIGDSSFNFPQLILASLFLNQLNYIHANEVAQSNDTCLEVKVKVTEQINSNDSVKTIGNRIDDCGNPLPHLTVAIDLTV